MKPIDMNDPWGTGIGGFGVQRIGQLNQAKQRNNARRGGTPNAPEINDEPAPAQAGATPVSGVPQRRAQGQAILGLGMADPNYWKLPGSSSAPQQIAGFGAGVGPSVPPGGGVARTAGLREFLGQTEEAQPVPLSAAPTPRGPYFAGRLRDAISSIGAPEARGPFAGALLGGAPSGIGGASVAASTPQNGGFMGPPAEQGRAVTVPPPGEGVSYAVPPKGEGMSSQVPSIAQPGSAGTPGSDHNPNEFAQQHKQMQQDEQIAQISKNMSMGANANRAAAWQDNQTKAGEARVAKWRAANGADMVLAPENSGYDQQRQAIRQQAIDATRESEQAGGVLREANAAIPYAGVRDPIRDFAMQQETANKTGLANQAITQGNVMRPLQVQDAQQRIAGGQIQNQLGGYQIDAAENDKALLNKIAGAKTPEERESFVKALLAGRGKREKYEVVDLPTGGVNPLTGQLNTMRVGLSSSGKIVDPREQANAGGLPEGETQASMIERAKKQVANKQMTAEQAMAELKSKYRIDARI